MTPVRASVRAILRRSGGFDRAPAGRWNGTPLSTRPATRPGRLAARCTRDTATERVPEHDDPCRHLVEHRADRVRRTPGCPTPHRAQVRCRSPAGRARPHRCPARASTASKSRWSRRHPCSASTHGVPVPYDSPNRRAPANDVSIAKKPNASSRRPQPDPGQTPRPGPLRHPTGTVLLWRPTRPCRATWPDVCWPDATRSNGRRSPPTRRPCACWRRPARARRGC